MPVDISNISIDTLHSSLFTQKQVTVDMLRLDQLHPIVSGNKLFKLHYFLSEISASAHKTLLTFGGAYSNHLAAAAFACREAGIKSIGIVRGERPVIFSETLQQCLADGMKLKFISREAYAGNTENKFIDALRAEFGEFSLVPEGGYHPMGAKGAAMILDLIKDDGYSHICTAVGTATTLAGLLSCARPGQIIIAIPVLKNCTTIPERIEFLLGSREKLDQLLVFSDHHFGGYAKKTKPLIDFMNDCWQRFHLPLDFVYTAKMLYGVFDAIEKDQFPIGSRILAIHTGGLQGNHSLPVDSLLY